MLMRLAYYGWLGLLGASAALAFPPYSSPWLIFVTMAVFVAMLNNAVQRPGFGYGYIFYIGASWAFIEHWFSYYFRLNLHCGYLVSYLLTFVVCLYVALYIGGVTWAYQRLRSRWPSFNLLILLPTLWTLTELIRGEFFPRSWYVLAYTQVANPLFRGYFPLFGMYFVSWLMLFLCGLLVYAYSSRRYLRVSLGLMAFLVLSYGLAEIQYSVKNGRPLKVALVQPNVISSLDFDPSLLLKLENIVTQQIELNSATVYVLPETVFGTRLENLSAGFLAAIKTQLAAKNALLLFGSPFLSAAGREQAGTLQLDGDDLGYVYIKRNLVPWGEHDPLAGTFLESWSRQIAGRNIEMLAGPANQEPALVLQQKIAINICYENSINDFVGFSAQDASIILNQSDLSWYGDSEMQEASLQFSQARALENQRYFLQDANTGITAVINPRGVIEARLAKNISATLVAMVQGYRGQTPFQFWGNFPLWVWSLLVILSAAFIRRRYK